MRNGTVRGTVDRIRDDRAVVLLEADGDTVDEWQLPARDLPADVTEGTVCELTFRDNTVVDIQAKPDETAVRRQRLRDKFDRLARRLGDNSE